jgi:hypothetical protein
VRETKEPGENHRPAINRWQTSLQNVLSCTPWNVRDQIHNFSCDQYVKQQSPTHSFFHLFCENEIWDEMRSPFRAKHINLYIKIIKTIWTSSLIYVCSRLAQRNNKWKNEWVGDCCLTPTQQFFSYIMARTSKFSIRWWWGPNNSLLLDMSPRS